MEGMVWQTVSILCCLALLSESRSVHVSLEEQWHMWKTEHGKEYQNPAEEELRLRVWKENQMLIEEHNRGNHSFILSMNHFGDMVSLLYRY